MYGSQHCGSHSLKTSLKNNLNIVLPRKSASRRGSNICETSTKKQGVDLGLSKTNYSREAYECRRCTNYFKRRSL